MEIKFTNTKEVPEEYFPKPSSSFIPDWYKNLESYMDEEKRPNGKGFTSGTVKRCMPVFDAITAGYIIVSPADVYVSQRENEEGIMSHYYEWPSFALIDFHVIEQMPEHPKRNGHMSYPKWMNPWAIKTPKGYSSLFIQPVHRESPFTILPGVVDTDTYTAPVNFAFVLNDINFEGLIPAGTPIAQVIPIKRDEWKMSLGSQEDFIEQQQVSKRLDTKFFDRYKSMFRQSKEYK